MSNLDSVFNTFVSGSGAYSNKFTDHAYNVANAGVVGAKKRDSYLSTQNSIATPTTFVPAGVSYKPTIDIETIGGVKPTKLVTNFMVNAKALVVVNDSSDDTNPGKTGFTKVTTFYPDKDGFLRNHVGKFLKVVLTDPTGTPLKPNTSTIDQLSCLNVRDRVGQPKSTTYVDLLAALPGGAQVGDSKQQSGLLFDSKGNQYNVTMQYKKINSYTGANGAALPASNNPIIANGGPADPANSERWRVSAVATTNTTPATAVVLNAAWTNGVEIVFQNGKPLLINEGAAVPNLDLTPPAAFGATDVSAEMNLGTLNQTNGLTTLGDNTGILKDFEHDGIGAGKFLGLTWDKDGYGIISYSNGTQEIVCRIPLVEFRSMNSLTEGSDGIYSSSDESGQYSLRFPEGEILPSAVEESTASATDTYVAMARDGKRFTACLSGVGKTMQMLDALERLLEKS